MKILDKFNMIRKSLKVNTKSRATLGPIGIAPLELNTDDQNFLHNFIVCTKLKQHPILGLDFTQRYRIGIDWNIYGKLFLRHEGKKTATSMNTNDLEQWKTTSLETPVNNQ